MAVAVKMHHAVDPAEEIRKQVGDLSGYVVYNNQILVGIYVRPDKTASGIMLPGNQGMRKEDEYQGKAYLILAMGPDACKPREGSPWFASCTDEQRPKVGDWIIARPGDTWQLSLNNGPCRMMNDTAIRMRIPAPDVVW